MQGYHPPASTYNHCHEGLLKLLIEHLGTDVDAREPAAVAGVTVVPADGIFQASDLRKSREGKGKSPSVQLHSQSTGCPPAALPAHCEARQDQQEFPLVRK